MTVGSTIAVTLADQYIVAERKVYPTLAAGATVISAAANWTYGAYAVIVPADTLTNDFQISGISVESCSDNAVYQLELYKGVGTDVVTGVRFAVEGGFFGNQVYIVGSEIVDGGSQVRARLASSDGALNQGTITISIIYIEDF